MVCGGLTLRALQFTEAVVNLKFDEDPKYAAYSSLFEPLCGATPARPILQTDAPKVCTCFSSLSAVIARCSAALRHTLLSRLPLLLTYGRGYDQL